LKKHLTEIGNAPTTYAQKTSLRCQSNVKRKSVATMSNIVSVEITSQDQWLELRRHNVGASEVGALFGIHDYLTGFALAARKLGKLPDQKDNSAMARGRRMEPIARDLLAERRQEWQQIPAGSYYYDPDIHFGATPDLFVRDEHGRLAVVQIKSAAPAVFARKWHNPSTGAVEPPLWIALQAMSEMHLTGADYAYVAVVMIDEWSDFHLETVEVPYLPKLIEQARERVAAFWQMIARGELPAPDYGEDGKAIAHVYAQADETELDLRADNELPELVEKLEALKMARGTAEDGIEEAENRIKHKLGHATAARWAGGLITWKPVARKGYTVAPSQYRKLAIKHERVNA
jgi:predicted phage-related endonuclease